MQINLSFDKDFDKLYDEYKQSDNGMQLLKIEGIDPDSLDIALMSKRYFTDLLPDVSIDTNANANEGIAPSNFIAEIPKGQLKLDNYYLLWYYARKRFSIKRANELMKAIWDGDIYFHDSSGAGVNVPYCFAFSTAVIMTEGRPYGQLHSLPPKRADSYIAQVTEVCMDLSNNYVGAISPADLLVNYAWYAKQEDLSEKQIQNDLQSFVHVMNNKFRAGLQSPFINISIFDKPNLEKLFDHYNYPDGTSIDIEYVMHIQKIFGEFIAKGDPTTGYTVPYRFPVTTINISKDISGKIIDEEFLNWVCRINLEKGCFNLYINDGNKIASCCRLINNKERMQFRMDSFGNGGLNIGSTRVVTVNLPRISLHVQGDISKFYERLDWALRVCEDLLIVHRKEILERRIKQGFLKFYKPLEWFSIKQLFSTIGIIGNYEMDFFMGKDIQTSEGQLFQQDVLQYIENFAQEASERNKVSFNVEEIPGESAAPNLCKKDKLQFGEEVIPFELYSNQYIPLIANASISDRVQITGKFMEILSGGGILHLNFDGKIAVPITMKNIIEYCVQNGVTHLAINYGFGTCENGHTTVCGNTKICPVCQGEIKEWMTRIVGYFTKTTSWNKTRREFEFPNRQFMEDK